MLGGALVPAQVRGVVVVHEHFDPLRRTPLHGQGLKIVVAQVGLPLTVKVATLALYELQSRLGLFRDLRRHEVRLDLLATLRVALRPHVQQLDTLVAGAHVFRA